MTPRQRLSRPLGLLLAAVLAAGAAQAGPASAAPAPSAAPATVSATPAVPDGATVAPPLSSQDPSGYRLHYDGTAQVATAALEQAHPDLLKPVSLATVLDSADRTAGPATCPASPKQDNDGVYNSGATGFCWDGPDTTTGTWVPQGITTNATPYAPVDGRQVVAASWYKSGNARIRASFADTTDPERVRYVHVMLVVPGTDTFSALAGHGDDVVWYKNRLYVGFGQGFHLFDLNHIWGVDPAGPGIGKDSSGVFSAENFGYVLPAVGRFSYQNPAGCGTHLSPPSPNPCNAGASLDLSRPTPAITTTEVTSRAHQGFVGTGGKIVRWPLDPATGLLRRVPVGSASVAQASEAWASPIVGAQGVVSSNGTHLISAPCPEYVEWVPGGPEVELVNSCVYRALPGQPVQLWKRASVHLQNLAYDAGRDALWFINENQPNRVVYSIPWPRFAGPLATLTGAGDLTGDGRPDLLAVDTAGKLWQYAGNGKGGYQPATGLGGGWGAYTQLVGAGDLTGDGKADLLAVDGSGQLWRYPGTGAGGFGTRVPMGAGWGAYTHLIATGDLTGDGHPDLLAREATADHAYWLYAGTGTGGYGNRAAWTFGT
ncbi:FG-GAP repeat domain-containing protein [Streptomyces purpureus]|uniref:FG-GAP repeat domain-containing protein n=1 Tax=Streptomyces purpureus TaxID=1951 RepID=UPI003794CA0D